ncbi:sugar kinase [Simiduia sp. 21SJ11W-1]|uniref:sugar kinase n=1 Tax=Simiduia sp. 21SJ11W-1 TaxID=2909669 RepID=UPI0020A0DA6F|nr:sugar kinase [Simiduia sp. 21SJ11W-1]UTA48644.1 sugar kinase [Simiduia sp. 21SJ11W-1]
MPKIAALGECMIELAPNNSDSFALGYAGDTLNTAVYLARFGAEVDYLTALGTDRFSNAMISQWQQEGIGTRHVLQMPGRTPGLYLIETDAEGERQFHYWRENSPARDLFDLAPELLRSFSDYDIIYLSGISLSLYSDKARSLLFKALAQFRAQGGRVAFDINYRPRNWPNAQQAQAVIGAMLDLTDIALPSLDDEVLLWGPQTADQCISRYRAHGCNEIVVKQGVEGSRLYTPEVHRTLPVPTRVKPLDTTAAGDSFNGGYLAARLVNESPEEAVLQGACCAALVIQHPGAIVPKAIFQGALAHD